MRIEVDESGEVFQPLVLDGVVAVVGNVVEDPENDWSKKHCDRAGDIDFIRCGSWKCEISSDKVDEKIFGEEVKKDGDSSEDGGNVPFSFFE